MSPSSHSTNEGTSHWDTLTFSFPDRWDRPWNNLAFLFLSALLWAIYGSSNSGLQFELYSVISAVVTVGAVSDLFRTIRVPRKVRLPDNRIEAERLFLPRIAWFKSDVEVHEKAGGLVIVNKCSPKRSRLKDTIVLPADYPRLNEIRELLTIDNATDEPCGGKKTHPPVPHGSTAAEDEDSGGTEDPAGGRQ